MVSVTSPLACGAAGPEHRLPSVADTSCARARCSGALLTTLDLRVPSLLARQVRSACSQLGHAHGSLPFSFFWLDAERPNPPPRSRRARRWDGANLSSSRAARSPSRPWPDSSLTWRSPAVTDELTGASPRGIAGTRYISTARSVRSGIRRTGAWTVFRGSVR